MDKRDFLSRFINGGATLEDYKPFELASLSTEELCKRAIRFDGLPGVLPKQQKQIDRCKDWIKENY